jgi:outer membrane protein OmpA-like peptidoglycan-associated protein
MIDRSSLLRSRYRLFSSMLMLGGAVFLCSTAESSWAAGADALPLDITSSSLQEGLTPPPAPKPAATVKTAEPLPAPKMEVVPQRAPEPKADLGDLLPLDVSNQTVQREEVKKAAPQSAPKPTTVSRNEPIAQAPKPTARVESPAPVPYVARVELPPRVVVEIPAELNASNLLPTPQPAPEPTQAAETAVTAPPVAVAKPEPTPKAVEPAAKPVALAAPVVIEIPAELSAATLLPAPVPEPTPEPAKQAIAEAKTDPNSVERPEPKTEIKTIAAVPPVATPAVTVPTTPPTSPPLLAKPAPTPTMQQPSSTALFDQLRQQGVQGGGYHPPIAAPSISLAPNMARDMAKQANPATAVSPPAVASQQWENFMSGSRQQALGPNTSVQTAAEPSPAAISPVTKQALVSAPSPSTPITSTAPVPSDRDEAKLPKIAAPEVTSVAPLVTTPPPVAQPAPQPSQILAEPMPATPQPLTSQPVVLQPQPAPEKPTAKMPSASLQEVYQQQLAASAPTTTTLTAGMNREQVIEPQAPTPHNQPTASATAGTPSQTALAKAEKAPASKVISSVSNNPKLSTTSLSRIGFPANTTALSSIAKQQLKEVQQDYVKSSQPLQIIGFYRQQPTSQSETRVISSGEKTTSMDGFEMATRQAESAAAYLLQLGVPMQNINIVVKVSDDAAAEDASWVEIQRSPISTPSNNTGGAGA